MDAHGGYSAHDGGGAAYAFIETQPQVKRPQQSHIHSNIKQPISWRCNSSSNSSNYSNNISNKWINNKALYRQHRQMLSVRRCSSTCTRS